MEPHDRAGGRGRPLDAVDALDRGLVGGVVAVVYVTKAEGRTSANAAEVASDICLSSNEGSGPFVEPASRADSDIGSHP